MKSETLSSLGVNKRKKPIKGRAQRKYLSLPPLKDDVKDDHLYIYRERTEDNMPKSLTTKSENHEWEEYLSTISFQMEPANFGTKRRLAIELTTWARENSQAYTLSQFYTMKGIPGCVFDRWATECPALREAVTTAKEILGDRREVGSLENRLNATIARFILPQYKREWQQQELWRATIHKDESERRGIVTVMLDPIESSELVPLLEKEQDA